jgi:tetratricopeptide (TPR) repeat protein
MADLYQQKFDAQIKDKSEGLRSDIEVARREMRMLSFFVAGIAVFFVVIMIYFVGHVSSKLKEWKDVMRQAEVYVKESKEITERTDKILGELDAKKTEILDFTRKQRDDLQAELERYTDLLQQNTEHRLREEVMGLRQKAEKELEQTLGELRAQVEHEIRRVAGASKEGVEKEFTSRREHFLQEVQSHTLFLEASFYTIHGKWEEALREYKKLVVLKQDHHLAWTNLGKVYRELFRYDEALESYNKALTLAPNDPNILYNIAATYGRMKRKEQMLETLSRAIANDGEYKDEALNDAAFREYWNDPQFKDLAEA